MQKSIKQNVKKVLALVLAFACAFTMFAGAAFTDSADIEQTEAVDMLTALGVIDGYEDGSFRPDATVTRAEAAKMIYTIRNGGNSNADAFKDGATTFTDLTDDWYKGYVKYCQAMGIISGKSTTTFDPDGQVTGTELAKMMLVTLGYDPETAGLEGTGWDQRTLGLASENALLDDVTCSLTAACPRQFAAQIMYNAVMAPTVRLIDGAYTNYDGGLLPTIGVKYMGLFEVEGFLTDASYSETTGKYTYKVDPDADGDGDPLGDDGAGLKTLVSTADFSDLAGQMVKGLFKNKNNEDVAYGFYVVSKSVTATVGELDLGTNTSDKKVELADVEYTLNDTEANIKVYELNTNSIADTGYTLNAIGDDVASQLTLVDLDKDGKYDYALVVPATVAKVTYVGASSITAGSSYKFEDSNIYDGVAKDDYALIIDATYTVDDKAVVTKVDFLEGEVTALKGTDVQIDGSWYKKNTSDNAPAVGDTVKMAVVGDYYYSVEVISGKSLDNVLMVLDAGLNTTGLQSGAEAEVMYAKDGSTAKVTVSKTEGTKVADVATAVYGTAGDLKIGGMYTYTEKDGALELTKLDNDVIGSYDFVNTGATYTYNATNPTVAGYNIADDAVVMVYTSYDDGKASYITGADLKDWSANWGSFGQALYTKVNGINTAKVIALYGTTPSAAVSGSTSYGYVTADTIYTKVDDTAYAVMTIWTADGELKDVKAEGGAVAGTPTAANVKTAAEFKKGAFVKFEKLANGNIDDVEAIGAVDAVEGMYTDKDGNQILTLAEDSVGTANKGIVDEDTVIVYVDTANGTGAEGDSGVVVADESATPGVFLKNVVVYDDNTPASSDTLNVVFVDVNNLIDGASYEMPAAADLADIDNALQDNDEVSVAGDFTLADGETFTVPATKTLYISGTLKLTDVSDLSIAGTLVADSIDVSADAGLAQSDLTTLYTYTDSVKVGTLALTGELTIAKGKTFTAAAITGAQDLTAAAGSASEPGATIVVTGNVADDVIANAYTNVTVGTVGGKITSAANSNVTLTGALSGTSQFNSTVAGTVTLQAAQAAANLEAITGAATGKLIIALNSNTTTTNTTNTNSNTAKFFSDPGTLDDAAGVGATAAVNASGNILADTYVWNTTTINAGQASATTNTTAHTGAWLAE